MLRRVLVILSAAVCAVAPSAAWSQSDARESLLSREPQTPAETFQAVLTMLRLDRPALARQYLDAFMASNPDDATLLQLRDQHGTGTFVELSRIEALQPVGGELLDRLNQAARNQLDDPAFQQSILRGLTGRPRERESALALLQAIGDEAAPLVIRQLAQGTTLEAEALLIQSLLRLGRPAIAPLEAALMSPQPKMRAIAADLLGRLEAREAQLSLTAVAFEPTASPTLQETARRAVARIQFGSPDQAQQVTSLRLVERLRSAALDHLARKVAWDADPDGRVSLWSWETAAGTVVHQHVAPEAASQIVGERLARQALVLAPDDPQNQALLLAILMWRDVTTAGWDRPIPTGPSTAYDLALTLGPDLTQQTLRLGLEQGNAAAAIVSLRALALTGSRRELLIEGSPVLAALQDPEPRVQFAAAETVLQLDPVQPFPSASRVVEILVRALNGSPQKKTVVVDPNAQRGAAMAGLFATLGYEPGLASTGQTGFEMAVREGNVELAVLHLNTVRWELSQTLANLRADPRTARLPIAVYGPPHLRNAAARQLQPYRLVSYLDDAGDVGILRTQLEPLVQQRLVPELTETQRQEEIQAAAFWLRHIASGQRTRIFPLEPAEAALFDAAYRPAIANDAFIALGAIGKPSVQQRLAEIGMASGIAPETQLAAIAQLAFHIQRYGRMLENGTAQQVLAAWRNASTPEVRSAWSAVIGALRPDPKAAATELLKFTAPPSPAP
jgi:hypothetical protein